jgi:hypothetical protein
MHEALAKFYNDPDWVLVEQILIDCLKQVSYTPESTTAPTDFKAQTLANKRLYDAVTEFLAQAKIVSKQSPEESVFN